jgi:hypothetical protein
MPFQIVLSFSKKRDFLEVRIFLWCLIAADADDSSVIGHFVAF